MHMHDTPPSAIDFDCDDEILRGAPSIVTSTDAARVPAPPSCVDGVLRGAAAAPAALDVLTYDALRDLCVAHFGYTPLCQHVFDACVDKDRQYVPMHEFRADRVPPGAFLLYFPLAGLDPQAAAPPRTRAGFLARVEHAHDVVVLHMKGRLWKVKYSQHVWLLQLKPMQRLEREVRSGTLNAAEDAADAAAEAAAEAAGVGRGVVRQEGE